ncbi:MAG TPA: thioredoxin domain-containing protein [Dehalococcoidia bacterium]|nr:thioredoxin domain-containing protein [Dehalococcoidia bacterium]
MPTSRSKKRQRQSRRRDAEQRGDRRRGRGLRWQPLLGWSVAALVIAGAAALVIIGPPESTADAAIETLAAEASGGSIQVLTGSAHTVYHSTRPLPSAETPGSPDQPTLIWFSGTWCEFCERMEPWIYQTIQQFSGRLTFVEKSVDHDRPGAARYAVRGTPTFVLVDQVGTEIVRFHYLGDSSSFAATVSAALDRAEG